MHALTVNYDKHTCISQGDVGVNSGQRFHVSLVLVEDAETMDSMAFWGRLHHSLENHGNLGFRG